MRMNTCTDPDTRESHGNMEVALYLGMNTSFLNYHQNWVASLRWPLLRCEHEIHLSSFVAGSQYSQNDESQRPQQRQLIVDYSAWARHSLAFTRTQWWVWPSLADIWKNWVSMKQCLKTQYRGAAVQLTKGRHIRKGKVYAPKCNAQSLYASLWTETILKWSALLIVWKAQLRWWIFE